MTTTIIPAAPTTITIDATLLSPFHHGAGTSGNTQVLRTQEVITPDGSPARVPFLSGASIRHALREALAWHLADTLAIEPGSLTKGAVDLIWTGGAVTTTGAQTDLAMIREVDEVLPSLAMLGYAAKSDIITGTLRASDLILVCTENAGRLPIGVEATQKAAAYRTEEFGTRHDVAGSPVSRYVEVLEEATGAKTTQMIWDTQVLKAGSRLVGEITLTPAANDQHRLALGAALALWAPRRGAALGAKTAQGYGRAIIAGIDHRWAQDSLARWSDHLRGHRDAVLDLINRLSS